MVAEPGAGTTAAPNGPASDGPPFAVLLRRHRRAAGLTQEALAALAGLSVRGVQDLERGARTTPQRETVRLLADALALGPSGRAALEAAVARRRGTAPRERASGRPPQGPDAPPTNLPAQLTSFVGREQEVAAVHELLLRREVRLLTLTGPGGVGKTRLALEAARAAAGAFPDGVRFVALAPVADPALVPQAVATVLAIRERPGEALAATLAAALAPRPPLLLVLDNCEHLVDACAALVDALLRAGPGVRVLATTREALRVSGEFVWRVPPLRTPPPAAAPEALAANEAVRLFVERAGAARPGLALLPARAGDVAELCRRLDGIPLALELAAARVAVLPVGDLLERLRDRFRLLTGGSRTALPRQQTLAATLDWSYDLLDARERTLFARLAVFAGGWSLPAAEAVAADPAAAPAGPAAVPTAAVLEVLTRLADRSLVLAEEDAEGHARFRMLETVREYALPRLRASGEADAVRRRHLAHFTSLAEAAAPGLQGPAQRAWLDRLEREHDNCRAALRWVLDRPSAPAVEQGLRLAGVLARLWLARGLGREARSWWDALLTLPGPRPPTAARAKALGLAAVVADWFGDVPAQDAWLAECAAVARATVDPRAAAWALRALGDTARRRGRPAGAVARLTQSLALFRQVADHQEIALTLSRLGLLAREAGDYEAARRAYEEGLAICRRLGNRYRTASLLHQLGTTLRAAGDASGSRPLHEEALAIWREQGYENGVAGALNALGEVALATGDAARAAGLFAEALDRVRVDVRRDDEALILRNLAVLAWTTGDAAMARARLTEAIEIWREIDAAHRVAETWETFAVLAVAHDQPEHALRLSGTAAATRAAAGCPLSARRRAALDRHLEPARRVVTAAAAAALERGGPMSPDAAVEAVLPLKRGQVDDEAGAGREAAGGALGGAAPRDRPPAPNARDEPDGAAAPAPDGRLRVDPATYTVWRGAAPLARPLAAKEFALVSYLSEHAGRVCSRRELGDAVWGRDRWDPEMLYRLVRRVKEKLEPDPRRPRYLRTVPGFGYRLAPEAEAAPTV